MSTDPQSPDPQSTDPLLGKTLHGKYKLVKKIGAGAMGTVYEAQHTTLHKRIALKVLHPDLRLSEETLQRFQQEGIAAGRIRHTNAIEIFDFDKTEEGLVYLAMEFVEGRSLKSVLLEKNALPVPEAIRIAREILEGLGAAHKVGIVHRDLKPENIMVHTTATGAYRIKVLDFGISKLVEGDSDDALMTQTGRIMGTPQYMSPEQCNGSTVDHRCDLYSLGLILFEMVAGRPPFEGNNVTEMLVKHTTEESPSLRSVTQGLSVPRDLERILARALKKKREERFTTAEEMLEALDSIDFERSAKGPVATPDGSSMKMVAVIVLLLVIAGGGYFAIQALTSSDDGDGARNVSDPALQARSSSETPEPGKRAPAAGSVRRVRLKDAATLTSEEAEYISYLDSALRAIRGRDVPTARADIEQAMLLDCKDAEAYVVRGQVYLEREDLDAARLDFLEAIQLDDRYAEAESMLGRVYHQQGNLDAAIEHFRQASAIDPSLGSAHEGLGIAHFDRGDYGECRDALERAIGLDRTLAKAHFTMGLLESRAGNIDAAITAFVQAKRNDTQFVQAYTELGRIYELQDNLKQAEIQYQDAIEMDPEAIEPLQSLAAVLIAQERFDDARKLLDEALRKDPGSGRSLILQGVVLAAEGDTEGATPMLESGLASTPDARDATILLGILYQRAGRNDDAVTQYLSAIGMDDTVALPHKNLGLIYLAQSRIEDAEYYLRLALDLDESDAYTHYALGSLYREHFDEPDLARQYLQRYRDLGGKDPAVLAWLDG